MTPYIHQLHQLGKNSWRCDLRASRRHKTTVTGRAKTALGAYVRAYAELRRSGAGKG